MTTSQRPIEDRARWDTVRKLFDKTAEATNNFTAALMLGLLIVVLWMVVGRNVFNLGQPWLDELARYLQIWVVFIAAFHLTMEGDHITMDAIYLRMSPKWQLNVRRLTGVITLLAALAGCYYSGLQAATVLRQSQTSASGVIPAIVGYASLPVGFALIAIASVYYLLYRSREEEPEQIDTIA